MLELAATRLAGPGTQRAVLIVGPSLGTSATALWSACAEGLAAELDVVGWDLPGHGRSRAVTEPFSVADLADAVTGLADRVAAGRTAWYAGDSLGGAVGLALARRSSGPFAGVASIAAAAKIYERVDWLERAELTRRAGTAVMVAGSVQRWFAPGFVERAPRVAGALLDSLADADDRSYAFACEALADFDLRDRLSEIELPVLVAAGRHDPVISPTLAEQTAAAIPGARVEIFDRCAHLPPAEDPASVGSALRHFVRVQEVA